MLDDIASPARPDQTHPISCLMKRSGVAVAMVLIATVTAAAANEVHIITRSGAGEFIGSHRLYSEARKGLTKVTYCGQTYFAYPSTVVWTEDAGSQGYNLALEHTDGVAWRAICNNPQDQVRSSDLPQFREAKKPAKRSKGGNWIDVLVQQRAARKN